MNTSRISDSKLSAWLDNQLEPEERRRISAWLRDHPEDLQRWLAGVKAFDGGDGVAAVQASLK